MKPVVRRGTRFAHNPDSERQKALLHLVAMTNATEREIIEFALEEVVRLTHSTIGYLHFVNADQQTLQLFTWSRGVREQCYAEETTHYPIEQAGVWVDCVRQRRPVFHNDYQNLPNRRGYPQGHIHLMRHLSAPLLDGETVVAVTGVGNKADPYDQSDARQLLLFMNGMWALLQRKRSEEALRAERAQLELRVAERTRELQQERDRTRAILESLGEAVIVMDTQGRAQYLNPAAARMLGVASSRDVDTRHLSAVRGADPAAGLTHMHAAILAGQVWQGEVVLESADGSHYDAAMTIAPLFGPDSPAEPIGFVSVHRDITAHKATERMKDQFVSNVSHELRSPTSLITLLAGSLEMLYPRLDDRRRLEMIGDIRKHAGVLSDLIGSVLEISRIDGDRVETDRERLDLGALACEEVARLRPIAERKSITIDCMGERALPVMGHAGQLQQVIRNLLMNAINYTPDHGHVYCNRRLFVAPVVPPDAAWPGLAHLPHGCWAAFCITDTGIGIEPEAMPHVFDRFFRAHSQGDIPGTGLGLPIALELVKRHAGLLEVSSVPNVGSSFAIYLPCAEGSA